MYIYILGLAGGLIICTGQYSEILVINYVYYLYDIPSHSRRRGQFPDNDFILKLHNRILHRMSSLSVFPTSCGRDCYRIAEPQNRNSGSQRSTQIGRSLPQPPMILAH